MALTFILMCIIGMSTPLSRSFFITSQSYLIFQIPLGLEVCDQTKNCHWLRHYERTDLNVILKVRKLEHCVLLFYRDPTVVKTCEIAENNEAKSRNNKAKESAGMMRCDGGFDKEEKCWRMWGRQKTGVIRWRWMRPQLMCCALACGIGCPLISGFDVKQSKDV